MFDPCSRIWPIYDKYCEAIKKINSNLHVHSPRALRSSSRNVLPNGAMGFVV